MVECPNGCVSCNYCGGLLADQQMIDNGDVEAVGDMHVDCAGEYQMIQKAEMQGDREWAENEAFEFAMCPEDNEQENDPDDFKDQEFEADPEAQAEMQAEMEFEESLARAENA